MPLRVERKGGIRKKRIGNDLPVAGRQQPRAPPRRLDAGADEPAGGGNEREGKPRDTQRKAPSRPGTTMEISKKTVDIAHHILAVFSTGTKRFAEIFSIKLNATGPGAGEAARMRQSE